MTHPDAQSPRAVNDILSSIRQIISEDAEEGIKNPPSFVCGERSFTPSNNASSGRDPHSREQVLELTRLVKEDGSVVNLARQELEPDAALHKTLPLREAFSPSIEKTDAEKNISVAGSTQAQITQTAFQKVRTMTPSEQNFQKSDSTMNTMMNSSPENVTVSYSNSDSENESQGKLLSEEALQESVAAFAALTRATQKTSFQDQQPPKGETVGHYTVDNLMRELLRPLLKEWLDAHLPSLVRTLVVEQIEKVLQQCEATRS